MTVLIGTFSSEPGECAKSLLIVIRTGLVRIRIPILRPPRAGTRQRLIRTCVDLDVLRRVGIAFESRNHGDSASDQQILRHSHGRIEVYFVDLAVGTILDIELSGANVEMRHPTKVGE